MPAAAWPTQLVLHARTGALEVAFADGVHAHLGGPRLRAACRCAACEQARRSGSAPVADAQVRVRDLQAVGEAALQLCFSDGHERGVYPFAYLYELAARPAEDDPPPTRLRAPPQGGATGRPARPDLRWQLGDVVPRAAQTAIDD